MAPWWKDANAQLKQLRADLKDVVDDVARAELLVDIEGKKMKDELSKLLGMTMMLVEMSKV